MLSLRNYPDSPCPRLQGKRTGYLSSTSSSPVNLHFSFPPYSILMATGNLGCVVVAVDGSEESMKALQWALDNLRLRPGGAASEEGGEVVEPGVLVVLHVQSPPSIAAGLNPGPIPFGGPSKNHAIVNHSIISLIFFLLSFWFDFSFWILFCAGI